MVFAIWHKLCRQAARLGLSVGILFFAFSQLAVASDFPLLDFSLRSLKQSGGTQRLDVYKGKPVLMIFFEPNCSWCFKQVKVVNRLQQQCESSFQPLAVGVHGNRQQLKQESRRLKAAFPTLQASAEMLRRIGKVKATPLLVLSDKDGNYDAHFRGYQHVDQLRGILASKGVHCDGA